jgi:hypothetical protein
MNTFLLLIAALTVIGMIGVFVRNLMLLFLVALFIGLAGVAALIGTATLGPQALIPIIAVTVCALVVAVGERMP